MGTSRDATDLQRVRRSLERKNRALRTLSACNRALVRAEDEAALLRSVGRILIERGGYEAAWLATADVQGRLTPAFTFGRIDRSVQVALPPDRPTEIPAPLARALHERRPVLVADVTADPGCKPWWNAGYGSCLILPLLTNSTLYGLLAIYTRKDDPLDVEGAALLEEMGCDLSYGIASLRARHERDGAQRALADSERSLRTLIERVAEGMLVIDPDGRVLDANPAAVILLGRPPEQLLGRPLGLPHVVGELVEVRVLRPDGSVAWADMRVVETEWYGNPALIIALHDTTAQRKAQEQIRLWASVFERSQEMILVTDPRHRIVAANRAFEELTGYVAADVLGSAPDFLTADCDPPCSPERLWREVAETGRWQGEVRSRTCDGHTLPLWLTISAAADDGGTARHYIVIASDIRAKKEAEARIEYLAYHDALTGLANRALLDAQLDIAIARARRNGTRFGVLFVDLDRFKNINDMLGHRTGDDLLVQVAQRLRSGVREEDTICRQGGDEFVVLLPGSSDPTDIATTAVKLLRAVGVPFQVGTTKVRLSASVGIAIYPEDGRSAELLVHNADTAMYFAKEQGRNNFQFYMDELNRRVVERITLENSLRQAVEQGDFVLHYQPQVRAEDGAVIGAEALLRWRSDEMLISPETFITVAEETGLIVPMGAWVLEEACRQYREWQREGLPPLRIAVNVSASQFRPKEMQRFHGIMKAHGVDPGHMELELTEGVLMKEAESSTKLLRLIKKSGMSLAIDDFGTGYSSLNYLRRFPIDRIKVDQSFIRDVTTDATDRAVTETIVALARSLRVAVVAEGVETEEEVEILRGLQCDELQGFYFAEPMPGPEFSRWWHQRLARPDSRDHG